MINHNSVRITSAGSFKCKLHGTYKISADASLQASALSTFYEIFKNCLIASFLYADRVCGFHILQVEIASVTASWRTGRTSAEPIQEAIEIATMT